MVVSVRNFTDGFSPSFLLEHIEQNIESARRGERDVLLLFAAAAAAPAGR